MGLLDTIQPAPTKEELQKACAQYIRGNTFMGVQNLCQVFTDLWERLWSNPDGLTPQEVCDSLGKDASQLFQLAQEVQTMISALNPGAIPMVAPYKYTINPDGSVTIGDKV